MSSTAAARSPTVSLRAELTTYVGRRAEISEARRLLETAALVTLTGPGGIGKTRLAGRIAAEVQASRAGDVVLVSLADLREPELLIGAVADQLGLGDRSARPRIELLVEWLHGKKLLLILDNCEHLVLACAQLVSTLLGSCPDLVVLATSRQSLGVTGERILPVLPLGIPVVGEPLEKLVEYDAVRLLVDRATAVVPGFTVTEDNLDDVLRLSRILEGLPLAIELAAVRLRALSVRQLADRLNRRFTLLNGERRLGPSRHETFQALIDWSHELCTGQEKLLWSRASVFSGSFELDAAEQICSGEGLDAERILDVLDALIDKSIVFCEQADGTARYRMLEAIRRYGEDQLFNSGRLRAVQLRHRDYYLGLTSHLSAKWAGQDQVAVVNKLREEHTNLRAAVDFCTTDPAEAEDGLRLVLHCKEYWLTRGLSEGRMWIGRLLSLQSADTPSRVEALWYMAFLALIQGDTSAYERALAQAEAVAKQIGDEAGAAYVLHVRGYAALIGNRGAESAELFLAAQTVFKANGDTHGELWSMYNYGLALSLAGELDKGRKILRDSVRLCVESGEEFWRCWALWSLGAAEYLFGDIEESTKACLELLRLQQRIRDHSIIAFAFTVLSGCATHTGEWRRAAKLFGAAATVWQSVGASPTRYTAFEQPMRRDLEMVAENIGAEAAVAQFASGAALSVNEAMRYALEPAEQRTPRRTEGLTKRETQIADLVASGMTNREIADQLVIAPRTAETHIDHIRSKLGCANRAQIAAWVVRNRSLRG